MEKLPTISECIIIQFCVKEVKTVTTKIPREILRNQKKHWIPIGYAVKNKEQQDEILSVIQKHCKTPCSFESSEMVEVTIDPDQRICKRERFIKTNN